MGKELVIVESPAKARTVGRFLGPKYEVVASMGHVRDLANTGEGQLGIDIIEDGQDGLFSFHPTWSAIVDSRTKKVDQRKKKIVADIKKIACYIFLCVQSIYQNLSTKIDRQEQKILDFLLNLNV